MRRVTLTKNPCRAMSRITGNAISGQTSQRPSNRNDKCHTRLTDSPRSTTVTETLANRSWWGYSWAGSYPILDIRDVHYRMSKSRHLKLRPNMASWFRTQCSEVASPYSYDRCLSSANLIIADLKNPKFRAKMLLSYASINQRAREHCLNERA